MIVEESDSQIQTNRRIYCGNITNIDIIPKSENVTVTLNIGELSANMPNFLLMEVFFQDLGELIALTVGTNAWTKEARSIFYLILKIYKSQTNIFCPTTCAIFIGYQIHRSIECKLLTPLPSNVVSTRTILPVQ